MRRSLSVGAPKFVRLRKSSYSKSISRYKKIILFTSLIFGQIVLTFFVLTSDMALQIILLIGLITALMFYRLVN